MSGDGAPWRTPRTLTVAIVLGAVVFLAGLALLVVGLVVGTATFGIQLFGSGNPCNGTGPASAALKAGVLLLFSGPLLGWGAVPALVVWQRRKTLLAWSVAGSCFVVVVLLVVVIATSRVCRSG